MRIVLMMVTVVLAASWFTYAPPFSRIVHGEGEAAVRATIEARQVSFVERDGEGLVVSGYAVLPFNVVRRLEVTDGEDVLECLSNGLVVRYRLRSRPEWGAPNLTLAHDAAVVSCVFRGGPAPEGPLRALVDELFN